MALQGSCTRFIPPINRSAPIVATCNMSHATHPYEAQCSPLEDEACAFPPDLVYPSEEASRDPRLGTLCALICSGCSS